MAVCVFVTAEFESVHDPITNLQSPMMQLMFYEKNAKNAKVYTKHAKVFTKNTKLYAKNAKVYVARLVRATRTCMSV